MFCPRCGEMFSYRPAEEVINRAPRFAEPVSNHHEPAGSSGPVFSNKTVAAAVLGVMAVMAVVGLLFALQTESVRRAHDVNIGKPQLVTVPVLVKIASNLWIIGLIVLLLSLWRNRLRQAKGAASTRSSRFRWVVGMVVMLVGVSVAVSLLSGPIRKQSS